MLLDACRVGLETVITSSHNPADMCNAVSSDSLPAARGGGGGAGQARAMVASAGRGGGANSNSGLKNERTQWLELVAHLKDK